MFQLENHTYLPECNIWHPEDHPQDSWVQVTMPLMLVGNVQTTVKYESNLALTKNEGDASVGRHGDTFLEAFQKQRWCTKLNSSLFPGFGASGTDMLASEMKQCHF